MDRNIVFLVFLVSILCFSSIGDAADTAFNVGIDKPLYIIGENITVLGTAYLGTSPLNATRVVISISNSSGVQYTDNSTLTGADGTFFKEIDPSLIGGVYNLTATVGDSSMIISFRVSSASIYRMAIVNESVVVPLSGDMGVHNISDVDSKITGPVLVYGNYTYVGDGKEYRFVVENSTDTENYDTVYVDDDSYLWFNNSDNLGSKPMSKYLKEGSKVKLGEKTFEIFYIDPQGSNIVFVEWVGPDFKGGESVNVLTL
ncbi:hypothetical protein GQ473_03360, partial [archaeon]|nr:hypothetical protein [archaeon]